MFFRDRREVSLDKVQKKQNKKTTTTTTKKQGFVKNGKLNFIKCLTKICLDLYFLFFVLFFLLLVHPNYPKEKEYQSNEIIF